MHRLQHQHNKPWHQYRQGTEHKSQVMQAGGDATYVTLSVKIFKMYLALHLSSVHGYNSMMEYTAASAEEKTIRVKSSDLYGACGLLDQLRVVDFKDRLNSLTAIGGIEALDPDTFALTLALPKMPARSLGWIDGAQNVLGVQ